MMKNYKPTLYITYTFCLIYLNFVIDGIHSQLYFKLQEFHQQECLNRAINFENHSKTQN